MKAPFLIVLTVLAACASEEERPDDLLPREKFTQVLLEAQLIEARINHDAVIDRRIEVMDTAYYARMFLAQGIDEAAFTSTYRWYVEHPAELKEVYNDVLTRLQHRVDVVDSTATVH